MVLAADLVPVAARLDRMDARFNPAETAGCAVAQAPVPLIPFALISAQSGRRTLAGSVRAALAARPVATRTDIPSNVRPARARILRSPAFTPKISDLSNRVSQTAAPATTVSPH